jgi:hypothetical protein
MAGYVRHLGARYNGEPALPAILAARRDGYRDQARADGHPRTAQNIASLALGWHEYLAYAEDAGAINAEERAAFWARTWKALCDVGAEQERYRRDTDPVRVYLRSLAALVASGRAHLAAPDGGCPREKPVRWGWAEAISAGEPFMRGQGDLIGWTDGDDVYLQPDVAYRAARQFAEGTANHLTASGRTVHKDLRERGLLASDPDPGHSTVRRDLGGKRSRHVLHLTARSFDGGDGQ